MARPRRAGVEGIGDAFLKNLGENELYNLECVIELLRHISLAVGDGDEAVREGFEGWLEMWSRIRRVRPRDDGDERLFLGGVQVGRKAFEVMLGVCKLA